jgi:hypothetical protein
MKCAIASLSVILLSSCVSLSPQTPWHPTQSGCTDRTLGETLQLWQEAPMSTASFRLAIHPDTGQGPTTLIAIDSGKLINLSNPDDPPVFIGAVGDTNKTCVVRIPLSQCPAASAVYNDLRTKSSPLGFGMDAPADILVFHAPTYYLEFVDGQGNHNQWRFYGTDHPLQETVENSINALKSCWQPASDAYHGR